MEQKLYFVFLLAWGGGGGRVRQKGVGRRHGAAIARAHATRQKTDKEQQRKKEKEVTARSSDGAASVEDARGGRSRRKSYYFLVPKLKSGGLRRLGCVGTAQSSRLVMTCSQAHKASSSLNSLKWYPMHCWSRC